MLRTDTRHTESAQGGLPRLLPPHPINTLDAHISYFGRRPRGDASLIREVEAAGLRGHGGAGFPTATKMAAVAARRRRGYVVVNATEGEPMSLKDKVLCAGAPHLVLDGAALAAETLGALEVVVCVDRSSNNTLLHMRAAIDERAQLGVDAVPIRLEAPPHRYVVGEESALVHWLNGKEAKPTFVPPRPFERGVGQRPTLVQNAETLAHVALIARHGAVWFRQLGTATHPGSALATLSGAIGRAGVYEIPLGIALKDLLAAADGTLETTHAVLVGGYFGTWIRADDVYNLHLDPPSLQRAGASFGCGVVVALPKTSCGLTESARAAGWLAQESAGQCGPCANGLPAIAQAMQALVTGDRGGRAEAMTRRWLEMVKGRGACRHPDGTARFVESSLDTFAAEIDAHRQGRCTGADSTPVLLTPASGPWR